MMKRLTALILALMLALSAAALAESVEAVETPAPAADQPLSGYIVMLYTSGTLGDAAGQVFERAAWAKKRFEEVGASVVLIDAGGTIAGSPFAEDTRGEAVARLLGAAGYDAFMPSAADLSYGAERIAELAALCPDVRLLYGETATALIERDGARFGLVAVSAEGTDEERASAATTAANALREQGCDVVIALVYDGGALTDTLAQSGAIDVLIDGARSIAADESKTGALIAGAAGGLGCAAIDPEGRCAAMLMTDEWFQSGEADETVAALKAELLAAYQAAHPTDEPTDEPTDAPTDEPTDAPTDEPTDEPTDAPADEPAA